MGHRVLIIVDWYNTRCLALTENKVYSLKYRLVTISDTTERPTANDGNERWRESEDSMQILLIEDEHVVAEMIRLTLEREGHEVTIADLGEAAIALAQCRQFDIAVLDLDLPDLPGGEVLARLRTEGNKLPTLVLSGAADLEARVDMLQAGADDFLTKPFDSRELIARLNAIQRRAWRRPPSLIEIGGLTVDMDGQCARVDGTEIPLTAKEYGVLELLAQRKGGTVAKEAFLVHLYGQMDVPGIKIIDVFVCKLRRKLAETPGVGVEIDTIWSRGYLLRETEAAAEVA